MSRSPSEHADDKQQTQQQNTPDNHTLEKNEHKRENVVEAFMRNFDEDFAYWTRRANEEAGAGPDEVDQIDNDFGYEPDTDFRGLSGSGIG
ncbi:hypothetical protein VTN49DRAFT_5360 [Thermomyces lanuginosus]|uniref:uncharacterized protein n=1 Tax=Thermomyces lanuginosus TaxID=5541 RepID=UPI00374309C2